MSLVEPNWKAPRKRSPQQQRRLDWEREYAAAQIVVRERSRGWCEVNGCDRPADTFHHKAGRRVPGANHPDLILHCCTPHHTRIHAHPEDSYKAGHMEKRT